jgi:hypothetical protein
MGRACGGAECTGKFTMNHSYKWTFQAGVRRGGTFVRRHSLTLLLAFLAVLLTSSAGNSQIVECRSEQGAGHPWAWREIDGRRCWYKGKAGMDKKLLRWADSKNVPTAPKRPPSLINQYGEREQLLHSYWPPLPAGTTEALRAKPL